MSQSVISSQDLLIIFSNIVVLFSVLASVPYTLKVVPYSITSVGHGADSGFFSSQPTGDFSHKPGGKLPLLSSKRDHRPPALGRYQIILLNW